jgi:hypothetical protein
MGEKRNGSDGRDEKGVGDDGRWCGDVMVVFGGDLEVVERRLGAWV